MTCEYCLIMGDGFREMYSEKFAPFLFTGSGNGTDNKKILSETLGGQRGDITVEDLDMKLPKEVDILPTAVTVKPYIDTLLKHHYFSAGQRFYGIERAIAEVRAGSLDILKLLIKYKTSSDTLVFAFRNCFLYKNLDAFKFLLDHKDVKTLKSFPRVVDKYEIMTVDYNHSSWGRNRNNRLRITWGDFMVMVLEQKCWDLCLKMKEKCEKLNYSCFEFT
eukprot:UN31821